MKWHDCKTDPPKESGKYLLWVKYGRGIQTFYSAEYLSSSRTWRDDVEGYFNYKDVDYKWAEVNLDEED